MALLGIPSEVPRWRLDWSAHRLLLLTATPHISRDFACYCLWWLLEPKALTTVDAFHAYPMPARRRHFTRRTKRDSLRRPRGS
jgi:hypothetical protein